jgi:hypothetical protein
MPKEPRPTQLMSMAGIFANVNTTLRLIYIGQNIHFENNSNIKNGYAWFGSLDNTTPNHICCHTAQGAKVNIVNDTDSFCKYKHCFKVDLILRNVTTRAKVAPLALVPWTAQKQIG